MLRQDKNVKQISYNMYIAIAGNIGSGKTTLTQILTKRYNAKSYLEEIGRAHV